MKASNNGNGNGDGASEALEVILNAQRRATLARTMIAQAEALLRQAAKILHDSDADLARIERSMTDP